MQETPTTVMTEATMLMEPDLVIRHHLAIAENELAKSTDDQSRRFDRRRKG
jgi:hypothetical protein